MFFLRRPTRRWIDRFCRLATEGDLSYGEIGATMEGDIPARYNTDRNRICLGSGQAAFERACVALYSWAMFDIGWVELIHPASPIAVGQTVVILAHAWGLYSLSASRILSMVDTDDLSIHRRGFVYGTLEDHVESGEERFTIEHHANDDSVWYDILAFSRPRHPLARLAYPASRAAQRRFARDSKAAMVRAAQE